MKRKIIIIFVFIAAVLISVLILGENENLEQQESNHTRQEQEDAEFLEIYDNRTYKNNKTVSLEHNNNILTAGIKNTGDGYIYINLKSSIACDGNEIGYYLRSSRGILEYSQNEYTGCNEKGNALYSNFVVPGRFYDEVIPVEFMDEENYGARWYDDILFDGTLGGTVISIRAVNLTDGSFLGIYNLVIGYNQKNGTYEIETLRKGDAVSLGYITEYEKNTLVDSATSFAAEVLSIDPEDYDFKNTAKVGAVVEKVSIPYFPQLIAEDGSSAKAYMYGNCKNTFALTIPVSYCGYITMYFAPESELNGENDNELKEEYKLYAYDPINPRSVDTMSIPDNFWN